MKTSKLALIALFLLLVPSVTFAQVIFPNRGGTGTTTIPSKGQVLVGKANGTYGPVSTSSLGISGGGGGVTRVGFTVPTGFSISGVPITSSGTGTLTYSSGYEGFKTASGTAWNSFYVTPSTRITAGDAIDWVGNTLNVITSGDWTGTLDTYNASDLLARASHTGTQLASTISDFVATVRTSISETITGIGYNNSTGVFTLDSGYSIPTTTRMGTWDSAFSWGNHASQGYITDGNTNWDNSYGFITGNQTITLSGDASGSGTTGITVAVSDDSHAHTGTTISGLDISSDTNLTVTATGIELSADAIALTTGYRIPTTTLMSNLGSFYNTPSGRITAGTGIDWTSNTLNTVLTAGDALTLTGEDFDFDGGATPQGELGGTWASPTIDDSLAVTSWNLTTPTLTTFFGTPCTGKQFLQDIADGGGFTCATATGAIATSTALANTQIVYGTAAGTVGSESAFTYNSGTDRVTVVNASTTDLSITSDLAFGGVTGSTWSTFCTAITGGSGLCDGVDATGGGGGGGSISTSTAVSAGNLAHWTGINTLSQVATGTLTETATGLEFSATRGLVGGASILSLTSGYSIPTTTLLSNVGTFYNTPSTQITAGTGIDWSSNTLNTVLTAGDGLTLTVEDFDCDTASGSVFGCLSSANWTTFNGKVSSSSIDTSTELDTLVSDDTGSGALVFGTSPTLTTPTLGVAVATSLNTSGMATSASLTVTGLTSALVQTGANGTAAEYAGSGTCTNQFVTVLSALGIATCASVTSAAITDSTITEPDLDADNSPGDTDYLQYDSTGTNFVWRTIANVVADLEADMETALDTLTSLVTVTISTTLTMPFGTTCDSNADGEICQDTSGNQLIVDGLAVATQDIELWNVTVGSTSQAFISSGLLPIPTQIDGYTVTRYQCHVTGGTSKVVAIEDASANSSEDITCGTTNTTDDGSITNGTFTASELAFIDFGATSGSVNFVSISAFGTWTRE
jgi:sulfopyruvate decarboxylase TPP-binding subunit